VVPVPTAAIAYEIEQRTINCSTIQAGRLEGGELFRGYKPEVVKSLVLDNMAVEPGCAVNLP